MSATTINSFSRVPGAFKLQFSSPVALVWVPLMVFVGSWAVAVGIGVWMRQLDDVPAGDPIYTVGVTQSVMWCLAFMAAYTASHTFAFSAALSYSRRVFSIGAVLAFAVLSIGVGVAFILAALVERATDGFWNNVYAFDAPLFTESSGILGLGALATTLTLFIMLFGFFWAILYRRVTVATIWTVALGVGVALVVTVMLLNQFVGWSAMFSWFGEQSTLTFAGWLLLGSVVLAVINYLVTRRASVS